MPEDQLFYVGQKAIIEKDGKVLTLNRDIYDADLPGGKIQIGELDLEKSFLREVKEETGLIVSDPQVFMTGYFKFHPSVLKTGVKKTELIFIVIYTVKLVSGTVKLSSEHDSYRWITKEDLKTLKDPGGLATKALNKFFPT